MPSSIYLAKIRMEKWRTPLKTGMMRKMDHLFSKILVLVRMSMMTHKHLRKPLRPNEKQSEKANIE
jgi:hypothetical protein